MMTRNNYISFQAMKHKSALFILNTKEVFVRLKTILSLWQNLSKQNKAIELAKKILQNDRLSPFGVSIVPSDAYLRNDSVMSR